MSKFPIIFLHMQLVIYENSKLIILSEICSFLSENGNIMPPTPTFIICEYDATDLSKSLRCVVSRFL